MSQAAGGSSNNKSGARRKCAYRRGAAKYTVSARGSDGVMGRAGDSGGMKRDGSGDGEHEQQRVHERLLVPGVRHG